MNPTGGCISRRQRLKLLDAMQSSRRQSTGWKCCAQECIPICFRCYPMESLLSDYYTARMTACRSCGSISCELIDSPYPLPFRYNSFPSILKQRSQVTQTSITVRDCHHSRPANLPTKSIRVKSTRFEIKQNSLFNGAPMSCSIWRYVRIVSSIACLWPAVSTASDHAV